MTGCAGFIGSHLIETLLKLNQRVVGLDNFATGHRKNLNLVRKVVGEKAWKRFHFVRGDIRKLKDCYKAFGIESPKVGSRRLAVSGGLDRPANRPRRTAHSVDIVLHQAALGSVPRSIKDPLSTHEVNVTGFVNMLIATRDAGVKRFVYASSSSVYGDSPVLPKREDKIGKQLSPYAVSKYANELYAGVFGKCYGLETIGLRYFNVFGPRQDPNGPYAAVIPRWIAAIRKGEPIHIYGDGKTSRDFCYVENAVQANILALFGEKKKVTNQAYNVACGNKTSLLILNKIICRNSKTKNNKLKTKDPIYYDFRNGDVRHSLASINKARRLLSFSPTILVKEGILRTTNSYMAHRK